MRGVIIPVDWDEKGNVIAAAIATQDEDEYRIDKRGKGGQLLGFIQEEVSIIGEMREERGKKIVRVKSYRLQEAHGQQFLTG